MTTTSSPSNHSVSSSSSSSLGFAKIFLLLLFVWIFAFGFLVVRIIDLSNAGEDHQPEFIYGPDSVAVSGYENILGDSTSLRKYSPYAQGALPIKPLPPGSGVITEGSLASTAGVRQYAAYYAQGSLPVEPLPPLRKEVLALKTRFGTIEILLIPAWSPGSVEYFNRLAEKKCARCYFHRKIKPVPYEYGGLLVGVMAHTNQVPLNDIPGDCPPRQRKRAEKKKDACEAWNRTKCECHGPNFLFGMVAWTEGTSGGPDFVISFLEKSPQGSHYTVFGQLLGEESFKVVEKILAMKAAYDEARVLTDRIYFDLELNPRE